jgi:hypothetical protein
MLRKLIVGLIVCLISTSAVSLDVGQRIILMGKSVVVPGWVLPGAAVDLDFANTRYFGCQPTTCLSITRASTGYCLDNNGLATSFASNTLRICAGTGLLIEEARTNDALWSRDMTNAAWVKTTMTTALNAVGIDGTASSATTLTATGASATVVQTITLASQADNYSVYLKRVTGSGTINLCLAATACGTATACTVTSTLVFTRCTVTATVLNPIVGIQIVTNGDAVIADFNQMEPGGFPTSPILTTNATATRAAEQISTSGALENIVHAVQGALVISGGATPNTANAYIENANDAGAEFILGISTPTVANAASAGHVITATLGSGSYSTTTVKTGGSWDGTGRSLVANNGTVSTSAFTYANTTPNYIGSRDGAASSQYDGSILRVTAYIARIPDATLKAATQ